MSKSKKNGLSLRTVKDIKAFLNMVICQAKDEGIIPKNSVEQVTHSKKLVRNDEYAIYFLIMRNVYVSWSYAEAMNFMSCFTLQCILV